MNRGLIVSAFHLTAPASLGRDQAASNDPSRATVPTAAPSVVAINRVDPAAGLGGKLKASRLRKVLIVPARTPPAPLAGGGQLTFAFFSPTQAFAFDGAGDAPNTFIKVGPFPSTPPVNQR